MNDIFNTVDPGPIGEVETGMPVVDVHGSPLGVVDQLSMGDPGAVTTEEHQPLTFGLSAARQVAYALARGNDLEPLVSEPLRTRLVRIGYLKLSAPGLLHHHVYVRADRVARVKAGRVELSVSAAAVLRED